MLHLPNAVSQFLQFLGENWLGVLFLLFICLLVVDIITGFGFLFSKRAPSLRGWALLAGLGLTVFAFIQGFRNPVISDYEIQIAGLPEDADSLTIVALSDLHVAVSPGESWLETQVERVNALKPDVIVLVGDIIEGHGAGDHYRRISDIMRGFSAPLGVWGVTGNHERYAGHESSLSFLTQANVKLLHNEWVELRPGLVLAGVDDGREMRDPEDIRHRFESALNGRPENSATVFLSHRPNGAEMAAGLGADLMLSGHTHGGQIWPFDYITARFNDLLEGKYIIDGMPVIVSAGAGTWGPRMRLWTPGDILKITLRVE
jgi:predicted MPP superfamily phosphohydrolase